MATSTQAPRTQLRSLYRSLLRELPSHNRPTTTSTSLLSHPSPLHLHIRNSLISSTPSPSSSTSHSTSSPPSSSPKSALTAASLADTSSASSQITTASLSARVSADAENVAAKIAAGQQFVKYVQAQRQYLSLIERYNPGMNMGEEERVRLTARRVGMNLPVDEFGVEK